MRASKAMRILRILYYIDFVLVIVVLALVIVSKQEHTAVPLDSLHAGVRPPVAENIVPLSDNEIYVPTNVKEGEVFFGIEKELLAAEEKVIWNLTNPVNSRFAIHVELLCGDNIRLVSSGLIPPGYCMQSADLLKELQPGQTSCTAYIMAYDHENGAYYGGFVLPLTVQFG